MGYLSSHQKPPLWRDERFLQALSQVVFLLLVLVGIGVLINNMINGLSRQGMTLGFGFFTQVSGFDVSETPIPYSRSSAYWEAFVVGLLNTLRVSFFGIILATLLGVVIGVARLSSNVLISGLAKVYVEIFRNLSLLVFLVFWYAGIFLKLPRVKDAIVVWDAVLLTNRGIGIPWGIPTETFRPFVYSLIGGAVLAVALALVLIWRGKQTGRMPLVWFWAFLVWLAVAVVSWWVLPDPLEWDFPYVKGLNLAGGRIFSPEFMALLSGLVVYTSAFIAEVVRAGILSVPKGQWEAARALGLSGFQSLRMVIFPQALRLIVPPLTSQYLNLTKNSSLAVAIGYPDLFYVSNTIINQSGRAVEMISLVMLVYLTFSLLTSLFMNWYNEKIRLVER